MRFQPGKSGNPAQRFQPGKSGNPVGRPRSVAELAKLILAETDDGKELVNWALKVWRDKKRSHEQRAAAHAWLTDRAFGRAPTTIDVTAHVTGTASLVHAALLDETHVDRARRLAELEAKANAAAASEDVDGDAR